MNAERKPDKDRPDQKQLDERADIESEQSFPASDPPSTTPVAGTRKAEQNPQKKKP